jgi:hypothetical protein
MAGELVPLVLLPRYTTLAGASDFTTVGMDVSDYVGAQLGCWRGSLIGSGGPTFAIVFEESTDQDTWTTCNSGSGGDPGAGTEAVYRPEFVKRWFRARVTLSGTNVSVSCWAVGFLERRET